MNVIDLNPTNQARLHRASAHQSMPLTELTGWAMVMNLAGSPADEAQQIQAAEVLPLLISPEAGPWLETVEAALLAWRKPLLLLAGSIGSARAALLAQGTSLVESLDPAIAGQIRPGDWLVVTPLSDDHQDGIPCRAIALRDVRPPWFEVEVPADGVYALTEPGHQEYVRSFLVVGEREAALIDTGMGIDQIRPLAESLTHLPLRVLLTHSHWDHIGGVHEFERVAVHEAEVITLTEGARHGSPRLTGLREQLRDKFFGRPRPPYFDPDRYEIPGFAQPDVLRDGDQIDLGGRRLRVIHTPGHSPGSICFFDADRRQLFGGDVFYYGPLYCHDFPTYLESTRRLAAMADQVDVVFPSHNELNLFGRPMNGQDLLNLQAGFERIARREAANDALARYEMAEAGYSVLMGFPY